MTTPCVLTLEGVDIPVWEAEFTQVVINAGGGGGGGGGPVAWGAIIGTLANQTDLALALAAKASIASLATVATSGAYADLTGTPMLGTAAAANLGDFAPTVHAHLAAAIALHVQACFSAERTHNEAIAAASDADLYSYDINVGWPGHGI